MLSILFELLGGWDKALHVLVVIMIAEYFTGMLVAIRQRKVNGDVMGWSIVRKILILFVVGLAALLDGWNEQGPPIFRMAAIYFYCGREGLSLLDQLGANGIPLPRVLKDFLKQLSEQKSERNSRKSRL
ncbi:toxin secretion/phage lysis holin [Paenibacillus taihuensis]|uniref:Toxin secretion/phage lysis holin n=1 Tax=Paenibacillus taihuensis TaxID=1156355 RepID=A0A3D9SNR7_9BACL|nr:phage holin family protein [Paenibacillus taihuensis]REE91336.1 toxin secretion/phage lysis holin [Paenibacillus taihuensis]